MHRLGERREQFSKHSLTPLALSWGSGAVAISEEKIARKLLLSTLSFGCVWLSLLLSALHCTNPTEERKSGKIPFGKVSCKQWNWIVIEFNICSWLQHGRRWVWCFCHTTDATPDSYSYCRTAQLSKTWLWRADGEITLLPSSGTSWQ